MTYYKAIAVFLFLILGGLWFTSADAGVNGPPLQYSGQLLAGDGADEHRFGFALDAGATTAAVGAVGWNGTGGDYQGAAYVFSRAGDLWTEQKMLTLAGGGAYEGFGGAVALDGDTLAVGAFGINVPPPNLLIDAGAVFVYTGAGATWSEPIKLMPADLVDSNRFGTAVALDGDTLVVGAPNGNGLVNEAVYIYRRSGAAWALETKLLPPAGAADFGAAVAISGDVALVGAPATGFGSEAMVGAVYAYSRAGTVWSAAVPLTYSGTTDDSFGCALDYDGQTAVVAECGGFGSTTHPLAAHVFSRDGAAWTPAAVLSPEHDDPYAYISSAAVAGGRIVLGLVSDAGGAAIVYEGAGATWNPVQTLPAPANALGFGDSVALAGDGVLVGASNQTILNNDEQGAVHAYEPAGEFAAFLPVAIGLTLDPAPADLIVYYDDVIFEPDIFTIRPDGTGKTNLTNSAAAEYSPRWSPDRRQIAFTRLAPSSASELWVMNADGSGQRHIATPELQMMYNLAWSPDGTQIALNAYSEDPNLGYYEWDIQLINVDGSGQTNLTDDLDGETSDPAWSPDGTRIVFSHYPVSEQRDLWLMNADGSDKMNLTESDYFENGADWSPDGQTILYWGSGPGAEGSLFVLPATGGTAQLLLESATHGRWSADGARIVFSGYDVGIFMAKADGSGVTTVDPSPTADAPDW